MAVPQRFESPAQLSSAAKPVAKLSAADRLRLVRQFVARVGGLENARAAMAMLMIMSRAA
jgi:hypothetical protein